MQLGILSCWRYEVGVLDLRIKRRLMVGLPVVLMVAEVRLERFKP